MCGELRYRGLTLSRPSIPTFDPDFRSQDTPEKWGVWDVDPSKRKGRYDQQLTLALKGGIHFKVHLLGEKETE